MHFKRSLRLLTGKIIEEQEGGRPMRKITIIVQARYDVTLDYRYIEEGGKRTVFDIFWRKC